MLELIILISDYWISPSYLFLTFQGGTLVKVPQCYIFLYQLVCEHLAIWSPLFGAHLLSVLFCNFKYDKGKIDATIVFVSCANWETL